MVMHERGFLCKSVIFFVCFLFLFSLLSNGFPNNWNNGFDHDILYFLLHMHMYGILFVLVWVQ